MGRLGRQYDLYNVLNTFVYNDDLTSRHSKFVRDAVLHVCENSPYTLYDSVFEWKRVKDANGNKIGEENYLTGIPTTIEERKEIDSMVKSYFNAHNMDAEIVFDEGRYKINIYFEEEE